MDIKYLTEHEYWPNEKIKKKIIALATIMAIK
jgi:hypothetical protein